MARSRTPARQAPARTPKAHSRPKRHTQFRIPAPVLWIASRSRPHTARDLLTLSFVCLSLIMTVTLTFAELKGNQPGLGLVWCVALLWGAFVTRTWTWWRNQWETMTRERVRGYTGSVLLALAAISVSWHFLSRSAGWDASYPFLGPAGRPTIAPFALAAIATVAISIVLGLPVGVWFRSAYTRVAGTASSARERRVLRIATLEDARMFQPVPEDEVEPDAEEEVEAPSTVTAVRGRASVGPQSASHSVQFTVGGPALPPIETFKPSPKGQATPTDLEHKAQRIQETLASFNVNARVVGHHCGPVVTQFDIQPERGVKVKSITSLQNDLALALAAPTIRIQAPVPGKAVVGIEIPNTSATTVSLRELLESDAFTKMTSPLAVVLGKDVAGGSAVIDLAKMPHLLIAGATGSGKSVCVNALISCLLYRNTPEQVRLMMVDPKMVELTVYNGVPHLYSPVITQMDKVVGVLQWALREMERRYQIFADNTVRNIQRYNEKATQSGGKPLPYIVLIIDELADLMMTSPEDVEEAICRLAQLARAAGIHLVIATQRPSVDVVTGLIKANFPARIAFAMTSQIDSRTILDTSGAEKLLGRGDMLYQPPDAPKPMRLQGAFLSDTEIEKLVEFWKRSPLQQAVEAVPAEEFVAAEKSSVDAGDDLLDEAVRVVREYQHASVSLLQRRLRIGYSRAARVMDQLQERGVVGPADGSKQRPVFGPVGESET